MTNVMTSIIEADVYLMDLRAQNFIVIRGTSHVVAVDFASAFYGYRNDEDKRRRFNLVRQAFLESFLLYKDLVFDWIEENMPEDI